MLKPARDGVHSMTHGVSVKAQKSSMHGIITHSEKCHRDPSLLESENDAGIDGVSNVSNIFILDYR